MRSVEPSSTTTSSRSRSVCPRTLSTAAPRKRVRRAQRAQPRREAGAPGGLAYSRWAARSPDLDLVVCTVGRTEEPDRLLASLERQTHPGLPRPPRRPERRRSARAVLSRHPELTLVRLQSPRGLSRARNASLEHVEADLVAFPDDDCAYPPDLLERVGRQFAEKPGLDGLTGRDVDATGRGSRVWPTERTPVTAENVWYHGLSAAVFLRRELVERVGVFDEQLGLGSETPWSSGEEVDYLIRAVRLGGRLEYDPSLGVEHEVRRHAGADLRAIGRRDGGSVGYLLRKHGYPERTVARMLVRPLGGAVVSLIRLDPARARFHLATFRGRVAGLAGKPAKNSVTRPVSAAGRAARRTTPRDGRATDRAHSARRHAGAQLPHSAPGRRAHARPRRRAPPPKAARRAPTDRVRNADARFAADKLDGPAARRVDNRQATRHRLDHGARTGVQHLRVQEQMRTAHQVGRVALGIAADQLDAAAQAKPLEQRLGGNSST